MIDPQLLPAAPGVRTSASLCRHCGDGVPHARASLADPAEAEFCCAGCASVFRFLRELRLDQEYYSLRGDSAPKLKPTLEPAEDFSALDLPPYRSGPGEAALDFFIEGIHCSACVWILERLPEMTSGVLSARLDIGRALLRVRVAPTGSFETAATLLLRLGYRPHAIRSEWEATERMQREDRLTLKRMGVAAFAAMNVMIYSISLYTGVDGNLAWLFRGLSLATALPALTFSAWPFYRSAFVALRNRRVSIDLPISLAFVGGFAESLRQVLNGSNLVYLDSITSLVFLMLASRFALSRLERAELSKSGLLQSLLPSKVQRLASASGRGPAAGMVRIQELRVGDRIEILPGTKIPADGVVEEGTGYVDLSFLSGESHPVRVAPKAPIYAGSRLTAGRLELRITALGKKSRLGEIESRLEASAPKRNERTERSDRWASIFLAVVIGLAGILLLAFGRENAPEAIRRSLSLLIIACPCALALATPLALARAFRLASTKGILIRDLDILERLSAVDRVIFDKTGTLTEGRASLRSWRWMAEVNETEKTDLLSVAYTMEAGARHPYGRAIARFLENQPGVRLLPELSPLEEVGRGVYVRREGSDYRLGRAATRCRETESARIQFRCNGMVLAEIEVDDDLRTDAVQTVGRLRARGIAVEILSGDSEPAVRRIAEKLGIEEWKARVTPEQKQLHIQREGKGQRAIVIGDGVNDALALRDAYIGLAFSRGDGSSVEATLASADATVLSSRLEAIPELLEVARRYRRTLFRGVAFSVFYNLVGASLAVAGFIHPIVAAVAMPVSALTLFISTVVGLTDLRKDAR